MYGWIPIAMLLVCWFGDAAVFSRYCTMVIGYYPKLAREDLSSKVGVLQRRGLACNALNEGNPIMRLQLRADCHCATHFFPRAIAWS